MDAYYSRIFHICSRKRKWIVPFWGPSVFSLFPFILPLSIMRRRDKTQFRGKRRCQSSYESWCLCQVLSRVIRTRVQVFSSGVTTQHGWLPLWCWPCCPYVLWVYSGCLLPDRHKLELFWKRDSQLRNDFIRLAFRQICWSCPGLMVDIKGSGPLWVMPSLNR